MPGVRDAPAAGRAISETPQSGERTSGGAEPGTISLPMQQELADP
ncbi:MAG TPA: hypothetical protein VEB22_04545 [Phycisphaerales bacterium]|nr:hypothetical protein [Phycisphaerales bacterium]